ncbi:sigma-E factor regulatory protein RseB [Pasteurellaceae bacterium 22721_9_1]
MAKIIKIYTALSLFFGLSSAVWAETASPKQLLESMHKAQSQRNYQMLFVQNNVAGLQTFQYKHINTDNKSYAQLTNLDGAKQDIIRRDNLVSYLHTNFAPFTIKAAHIVDHLPQIMSSNINKLAENYDFSDLGRNRIADRLVKIIKIMPKDNFRYQYVVFIDDETQLVLHSDMIDRAGNVLESFHVVNLELNTDKQLSEQLDSLTYPPLLTEQHEAQQKITNWTTTWLPKGFHIIHESIDVENKENEKIIESRLYSDGLFSFTIYVADKIINEQQESLWQQGANTIYSETINDKEITLIGQIPAATAKRIVQDIKFK